MTQSGFLAALEQSGGSTSKALLAEDVKEGAWSDEEQMFALAHQIRAYIITSPQFQWRSDSCCDFFEGTMDPDTEGQSTADYLWNKMARCAILKVDKGLADESDGVHWPTVIQIFRINATKAQYIIVFRQPSRRTAPQEVSLILFSTSRRR
jgi:fructose-bisphosphate aldolase class 1